MDKRDIEILKALQDDGRLTNASLAMRLNMAEAPAWRRLKALEDSGLITGYRALLDRQKLGYEVTAFVQVRFASRNPREGRDFEENIRNTPEILWCHNVTGPPDFLLCVVARNTGEYGRFIREQLRPIPGVISVESTISLMSVKDDMKVPID